MLEIAANENNPNAYLLLGRIYKNGKHAAKDVDKAIGYFTKCLDERMKYAPIRECSLELGDIYNNLGKKNETLKYCKQAVETSHYYEQKGREYAMCSARIQSLQKMNGMQAALAHEIELEAGKNVKEFFVYKSAIKPCKALMKENPGYGRASKECNDIVQPLYEESIKKAIRGITALAIAENGKVDNELIENTYYYLAMFLANNEAFIGDLEKNSPNPGAIDELYDLNRTVRRRMFYIWYLRQIPYAAKDVFETKSNSKSWDSYLKEADKAIAKDDALKTGFGIDLLKYIDY